jgi:hypothetical protein
MKKHSEINTMTTRTTNGCGYSSHVVTVDLVPSRANPPGGANMLQASFWWFIGFRWPIYSILQDQSIWKCGIHDSMTIPHMVAIMEPKKLLAMCKFASDHHLLFGTSSSWAFKVLARLDLDHRS